VVPGVRFGDYSTNFPQERGSLVAGKYLDDKRHSYNLVKKIGLWKIRRIARLASPQPEQPATPTSVPTPTPKETEQKHIARMIEGQMQRKLGSLQSKTQ
jgi:hypothetical protein